MNFQLPHIVLALFMGAIGGYLVGSEKALERDTASQVEAAAGSGIGSIEASALSDSSMEADLTEQPGSLLELDVTVTIYHAVPSQTDDTPMITADGTDLSEVDISQARYCALSRDLLSRWGGPFCYGDAISIESGDPAIDGIWYVHDTMAARWTNRVDLLMPVSVKGGKWEDVLLSAEQLVAILGGH